MTPARLGERVALAIFLTMCALILGLCGTAAWQDWHNPMSVDQRVNRVTVSCRDGWALSIQVESLDVRHGTWTCVKAEASR